MHGARGHRDDDVDGEEGGEEEEEEQEKHRFGSGDDDADAASSSALVTNLLPLEAPLPTTSSTQGPLELIKRDSELTSLGKLTG